LVAYKAPVLIISGYIQWTPAEILNSPDLPGFFQESPIPCEEIKNLSGLFKDYSGKYRTRVTAQSDFPAIKEVHKPMDRDSSL
jgi:hypothetical protein